MVAAHLNERSLPLRKGLKTAQGPILVRRVHVLVLQDDAGNVGLGEAAPLPAFGSEDPLSCQEALNEAVKRLPEVAQRWLERDRADAGLGPLEKVLVKTPCARACVEGALLDLYAQRHGRPLADVLRSTIDDRPCLRSLPVNTLLAGNKADDLAEAASSLIIDGWRTFKLKVNPDPAIAVEQVATLRDTIGSAVQLRVDANGAWDVAQAQRFLHDCADFGLEYLEQPVPAADLDGLAKITASTLTPIAADESVRAPGDIGRIAALNAANIIIIKPMALGGWRPTRQAVELANNLGLGVVVTSFLDGCIGRALATHMAAALELCDRAQGLATGKLLAEDLTDDPLRAQQGVITLNDQPGLGIGSLNPEMMA